MTQRVFDIKNEKDMQDLWGILPDDIDKIEKYPDGVIDPFAGFCAPSIPLECRSLIKINWHDKTEITRPIQEATEQDIGKLCAFWDYKDEIRYGKLDRIFNVGKTTFYSLEDIRDYDHARRLTKQEIEELC